MQEKRPRWTTMSSTKLRPHGEQLHATWSTWSAASAATGRVLGCWQLQDAPDYHLSRARGQGRLRRCEGVLWTFKHRKISKSRKRALLGYLARSGPRRAHRLASTLPAVARATVVCFLRCECLRGRDVGRPRDPSRRLGARCWLVYEYTRPTAGGQTKALRAVVLAHAEPREETLLRLGPPPVRRARRAPRPASPSTSHPRELSLGPDAVRTAELRCAPAQPIELRP